MSARPRPGVNGSSERVMLSSRRPRGNGESPLPSGVSASRMMGTRAPPGRPSPARMSMTVLLSVQGLTKRYGPRPLFTDLSLDLRAGERVGLIGPNGSGKSTLLRLLAGREEPDAGERS